MPGEGCSLGALRGFADGDTPAEGGLSRVGSPAQMVAGLRQKDETKERTQQFMKCVIVTARNGNPITLEEGPQNRIGKPESNCLGTSITATLDGQRLFFLVQSTLR